MRPVELAGGHSQYTSQQGDKGAHHCCEAPQEHARDTIFADQLCAALDQPGEAIERPASEYLPAIAMSEPKGEAVAGNCSGHRGNE